MTVRVLFFSSLRAIVGLDSIDCSVAEGATVAELIASLQEQWPALKDWDEQLLLAVDLAYTSRSHVLRDGQEVALMPPVQGG